jgi:hypothetical protein
MTLPTQVSRARTAPPSRQPLGAMPPSEILSDEKRAAEADKSIAAPQTNGEGAAEQKGDDAANGHADSTWEAEAEALGRAAGLTAVQTYSR